MTETIIMDFFYPASEAEACFCSYALYVVQGGNLFLKN